MEHSYLTEVNANFCCRVRCCYYNHDSPLTHFLGYNHEFGTSSSFRCISIVLGIVRFEHNVKLHTGVVHGGKQRQSEGPTRLFKLEGEVKDDNLAIVLVHPYSVLGGSQGLLKGIASGLAQNGYAVVTFDMRGVGSSTGVKDVVAISNWLSSTLSLHRILLVGSSAGAPIAGSAVDQIEQVIGYVSIGYPFGMTSSILFGRHHKAILQSPKPKLFIMGTRDGFTSVKQLKNKLSSAAGRVETHLVDGVGHFQMEGPAYDSHMVDLIIEFIASL